jgi:AraC-like DNA-binding protein
MVSTIEIKPAAILQPFVSCYALRKFNTENFSMPRPMHAVHEYVMSFFLKDKFCDIENAEGITAKHSNSLTTPFTKSNGCGYWKGDYKMLCIHFKSNGIFAIFGIPQRLLLDTILSLDSFLGMDNAILTEQFAACKDIQQMGNIMNEYLTRKMLLQKHKAYTIPMARLSGEILKNKGIVSIDALVLLANMSFRNFERRFVDEVGMPPKLYARITRFYNAIENKMLHPYKRWIDIANENGYYDQAHFIREVREFSDKTPEELFKDTPPPPEKFITKVEH